MEAASLSIVRHSADDSTARAGEAALPVPLWSYGLDVGPALLMFYQYCLGRCRILNAASFETSYGELLQDFATIGERTVKRWIEDLREPLDDDQPDTKYLRLGLLRLNKAKLAGWFSIEPLPPADLGPRASPARASPQKRFLPRGSLPQDFAQSPAVAVNEPVNKPQEFAQSPAVESQPQTFAQSPAVENEPAERLARLLNALVEVAGQDRFDAWFGPPVEWIAAPDEIRAVLPHRVYADQLRRMIRSVIGPACRRAFPRGASCQLVLAEASGPAENGGGRDRPQDFAQSPAVLFLKLSSLGTLKESLGNQLEVQGKAAVAAVAERIAARFANVPPHFYRWQWLETAWAVVSGRIADQAVDGLVSECLGAHKPVWAFAHRIKRLFKDHGVGWLDASTADGKAELAARLAKLGVEWDSAWEGSPRKSSKSPKPR